MTLRSVMLQLSERQIERLDKEASAAGVSRSHLVRVAVDEHLSARFQGSVAEQYALAYPSDGEADDVDEFGNLTAFHRAAAADRQSDREPW
jgi:Ribbon-helix-helix protein, copG family